MQTTPSHVAVTPETAAGLVGVTARRVGYWRETGLVVPSVVSPVSGRHQVRLYRLPDLVELRTVAELRRTGVSLQHVRKIVEFLRKHYDAPLRELRFGVYAGEVYFQHPDGSWEGDRSPGQIVLHGAVPVEGFRTELLRKISEGHRRIDEVGQVVRRRRVHGSQPVFAGTRVPVSSVTAYLDRGYGTEQILDAYPQLSVTDIDAARQLATG